ncbi:MAG: hypothetical protein K8I02_13060 [Candidatus Methylomirabilis sp.]|nr:hypothetical protein [Deltaproteobacteria bacterium]
MISDDKRSAKADPTGLAHEATADLRKTSAILGHKPKGLDAALKEALGV